MKLLTLALALVLPFGHQAADKKKVACTLPVLKAITDEIATDAFETFSLCKADQDPHGVSPTPLLMNKVREAELMIEIGLQLELWADQVANGSGNPKIAKGAKGRVVASAGISREEVPTLQSRSEGDLHPEGNPHLWTDPLRVKDMADNIATALKEAAPSQKDAIDAKLKKFKDRIDESLFGADLVKAVGGKKLTRLAHDGKLFDYLDGTEMEGAKLSTKLGGWLKRGAALRGINVLEFHRTWIYLAKLYGFEIVGAIEAKPGIEPGPKHMETLAALVKTKNVKLIIVDNFYAAAKPNRLAEETAARVVIVANQPGGDEGTGDYFAFMDYLVTKLTGALR